jgi:DNA polymerase-3 subunit alpha
MEALIYSGALDIFGKTKKSMIESKTIENDIIMTHLVGVVESNDEYDFEYLAENEAKYLGINIQYNLFNDLPNLLNKYRCVSLKNMKENSFTNVIATISKSRTIKTKKGENMLVLSLTDGNTDISAVIFPKNYERLLPLIKKHKLLYITGPLERDKKNLLSFSITDIKDINN